ncbi:unnamed protein product [Allacma fusca]|uniref:C2 domain-containing protein n=1 Tax=Allacma fusca TaxID=39272 RepID=A0A8J2KZ98_9HEXA|nr:unnamed protein product [Allacma fusca]
MGALQALVTIVGLIGILALLLLIACRYLGGWTWSRAWLTSSREEKMVLTRGTGQYHPNGFMIQSDSDLNLSGGGSFRRFDKTDHDYQLLRQGSAVSIPSQSSIPPQPLRPAPSLPASLGQARLDQQSSVDSVFTDTPPVSMPPPRIPPPPPSSASSSSTNPSRALPSFSMTNPFLPLLQASTQFFSQTLQGLHSLQNSGTFPGASSTESSTHQEYVHETPTSLQHDPGSSVNRSGVHSSTSSGRSGMSMGELLFSAPPVVPISLSSALPTSGTFGATTGSEYFQNSAAAAFSNPEPPVKLDSSNPFSPQSTSSYDQFTGTSQDWQKNGTCIKEIFTWADKVEEITPPPAPPTTTATKVVEPSPPAIDPPVVVVASTNVFIPEPRQPMVTTVAEENSIFDQIRDFNELTMSKNLETIESTTGSNSTSGVSKKPTAEPLRPSQGLHFTFHTTTNHQEEVKSSISAPHPAPPTTLIDNRDPLKSLNSIISSVPTVSSHFPNFTPYRNARSYSLRQASTDSIGSESDLGSPDGSLPSLQRAMSCDSVCSDTSVVLGDLDQPQLTGHLCIGLEYDSETADLLVNVIEAKEINGLHPDPTTPFDSYIRVYLLPDKTTNMQTRVYRKSLNPVYKEKFMFGLELAELQIRSLVFYMYATDKFSNTLIGEAELKLGELDIHQLPLTTWLPLTDSGQRGGDLGEIMFSLSYLPTAERLTVVVVKARNLKFPRENVGDPFVKVYLLQRGKKVSKKKSSMKKGERNPIFNEAMIFGVPAHALQTIQLRVTVADSSEAESNRACSIGHVIVGSTTTGKPLSHWNQMLSSLRKPIAMWHSLRK